MVNAFLVGLVGTFLIMVFLLVLVISRAVKLVKSYIQIHRTF